MNGAIDTTATREIEASPTKLILLAALALGMAVLGAALAFGWIPVDGRRAALAVPAGWAALLLFGAGSVFLLYKAVSETGPVVTLSPEGFRDTRIAPEMVPWGAVTGLGTWATSGQKMIVVGVLPEAEARLTQTRLARMTRKGNAKLGADGLIVNAQGLKVGHDELMAQMVAYAEAHRATDARAV